MGNACRPLLISTEVSFRIAQWNLKTALHPARTQMNHPDKQGSPTPSKSEFWVIIDPAHKAKVAWDMFISGLVILSAIFIPYRLVFHPVQYQFSFWFDPFYWVVTVFLCLDCFLNFNTGFLRKQRLITDRKAIAWHYLRTWLIPDAIASVPIGPIILASTGATSGALLAAKVFLLMRLSYLFKLGKLFSAIERALTANPAIMRLVQFCFWFALMAHCLALGWVAIGGAAASEKDFNIIKALTDPVPAFERYIRALYFMTTTMATIGYGDISPHKDSMKELIYTMFVQIVGVGMYGYVIGNVASLLANLDKAKAVFQGRMEEINAYMRAKRLPLPMQAKIRAYFDYMWEIHQSTGEESTLDKLPSSLSLEVQMYLNRGILTKVPFFRDADEIFIREIIIKLRHHTFLPGDLIMRKGEYGDCMYFISSGHVSVLVNDDKTVVAVLEVGSHVGEMSLIAGGSRNASVRAEDYCEVYELSKMRFDELRAKYPMFDARVKEVVAERDAANKQKK